LRELKKLTVTENVIVILDDDEDTAAAEEEYLLALARDMVGEEMIREVIGISRPTISNTHSAGS
jgi:hypothetical protein